MYTGIVLHLSLEATILQKVLSFYIYNKTDSVQIRKDNLDTKYFRFLVYISGSRHLETSMNF